MLLKCKSCEIELSITTIRSLKDIDFTRMGCYCHDCFSEAETKIKELRFVEEYKVNKIYSKDGKYAPYWGCLYCFDSIEGARNRINNSTEAVVNLDILNFINA